MNAAPIEFKSQFYLKGVTFIVVLAWGFMGFEIAQYHLLNLYENPIEWISWASFLFISILPVLIGISWKMKTDIKYSEPKWDFREREVTISEYEKMIKQYRRAYQIVLSIIDIPSLGITVLLFSTAILAPFVLMRTTFYLIAATPIIFGFLVLLFGVVFTNLTFKYIPNDSTPHFSYTQTSLLSKVVRLIGQSPGISWVGVRIIIGEAGGYFTIREPKPVARIEDIESAARIECQFDDSGDQFRVRSILQLEGSEESVVVDDTPDQLTPYLVAQIVQKTILSYIETRGGSELLEEVLDDLDTYLKRFIPSS